MSGPSNPHANSEPVDTEDRRKHLELVQSVVNRMSAASATTKGLLLPVITAAYGYALVEGSNSIAVLGVLAVLLFAVVDVNYLAQERRFRAVYNAAISGAVPTFTMDFGQLSESRRMGAKSAWWRVAGSWSIAPLYGAVLAVGIFILFVYSDDDKKIDYIKQRACLDISVQIDRSERLSSIYLVPNCELAKK